MKKLFFFFCLFLFFGNLHSQSVDSDQEIDKTITFDNDSKLTVVEFHIRDGDKSISLNMESTIRKGDLEVKLIRPDGKKAGGFKLKTKKKSKNKNGKSNTSVSTSSSSNSDDSGTETFTSVVVMNESDNQAKGNMSKVLTNPEPGLWKVRINPKSVTGEITLKIEWQ